MYWTLITGYLSNFTELLRTVISFLLNLNLPANLFNLPVLFLLSYSRVLSSILSQLAVIAAYNSLPLEMPFAYLEKNKVNVTISGMREENLQLKDPFCIQ